MSLRQLCRETTKRPSKALLYFPHEMTTGIAPTRLILDKSLEYKEGTMVTVNWEGKKIRAEIVALDDNEEVLNKKDAEWSSKFLSVTEPNPSSKQPSSPAEKQKTSNQPRKTQVNSSVHKASPVTSAPDPYAEFLAEQRKREAEWSSHRAKKQARITEAQNKDFEEMKQQLAAKEAECTTLKSQLDCLQRANVSVVEAVHNKVQESFCKMMETLEDTLSAMEDNMSQRLHKIEHRLNSLEKVFSAPKVNFDPLPLTDSLPTIDHEAFASLSDDSMLADFDPLPSTPLVPSTPETSILQPSSSQDDQEVGEDVIRSLVTPSKSKGVRDVLEREKERHRCALKLLPFFFTTEELSHSNTEGTHNKQRLDITKLQALKVLVFSRFPLESATEKDKVWKCIKSKINSKCRLSKHTNKHAVEKEN